jgi:hypothetical protein
MFPQLQTLKVLAVFSAMAFSGWLGYDYGTSKQIAEHTSATTVENKKLNSEALANQSKSLDAEKKVALTADHIESIKQQAVRRVEETEPKVVTKVVTKYVKVKNDSCSNESNAVESNREADDTWTFDNGTVRLLNSARAINSNNSTIGDNASDQTPSRVKVSDLVKNDLEVVALYHEQSVQFKALQDYVKEKQDDGYMFCKVERPPM